MNLQVANETITGFGIKIGFSGSEQLNKDSSEFDYFLFADNKTFNLHRLPSMAKQQVNGLNLPIITYDENNQDYMNSKIASSVTNKSSQLNFLYKHNASSNQQYINNINNDISSTEIMKEKISIANLHKGSPSIINQDHSISNNIAEKQSNDTKLALEILSTDENNNCQSFCHGTNNLGKLNISNTDELKKNQDEMCVALLSAIELIKKKGKVQTKIMLNSTSDGNELKSMLSDATMSAYEIFTQLPANISNLKSEDLNDYNIPDYRNQDTGALRSDLDHNSLNNEYTKINELQPSAYNQINNDQQNANGVLGPSKIQNPKLLNNDFQQSNFLKNSYYMGTLYSGISPIANAMNSGYNYPNPNMYGSLKRGFSHMGNENPNIMDSGYNDIMMHQKPSMLTDKAYDPLLMALPPIRHMDPMMNDVRKYSYSYPNPGFQQNMYNNNYQYANNNNLPRFNNNKRKQQYMMGSNDRVRKGPSLGDRPLTPPAQGWYAKYSSGVTGVVWDRVHQAWVVSWTLAGKRTFRHFTCKSFGGFDKAREAAIEFRLARNKEIAAYNKKNKNKDNNI